MKGTIKLWKQMMVLSGVNVAQVVAEAKTQMLEFG